MTATRGPKGGKTNRSAAKTFRLVALDIDGTLLNSSYRISDRTRRTLRLVIEQGTRVVLVTGRTFAAARPVAVDLGLETVPLVAHNGALTKDAVTLEVIDFRPLPRRVAVRAVQVARSSGVNVAVCDDPEGQGVLVLEQKPRGSLKVYIELTGLDCAVVDDLAVHLDHDPIQVSFSGPCAAIDRLEEEILGELGGQCQLLKATYLKRDLTVMDLVRKGCSKKTGLVAAARRWAVPAASVLAVGDNLNDVDMLRWAGKGVVMGNAFPDLKQMGFEVTGTNDEDGAAMALEKWALAHRTS